MPRGVIATTPLGMDAQRNGGRGDGPLGIHASLSGLPRHIRRTLRAESGPAT